MSTEITAKMVGDLRSRTGAGIMDCKTALKESNGNLDEAITYLKKKGVAKAAKRAGKKASEGIIECYIHLGSKIGAMVELNCETDFVAKNDSFKKLAEQICMHIVAANPLCVNRDEIPAEELKKEREVARAQCEGKPENIIEGIVEGKVNKWISEVCLLEQSNMTNPDQTIQELLNENIAKMGENIVVSRFACFQIGG